MEILYIFVYLGSIFSFLTLVFLLALLKKDNSIMDIAYGPTYTIAAFSLLWFESLPYTVLQLTILGCVLLWSLRLSIRIARKNIGSPEDERYANWRKIWLKKGQWYFFLRSYVQIYLLQGVVIGIVGLPILASFLHGKEATPIQLAFLLFGVFVFATGLAYETIADLQLDNFIKRKKAKQTAADLMTSGLFKYSRRPNYFGEALLWTGIALIALPTTYGWLAIVSPILITYIVTQVTGPMLEQIFLEKFPQKYRAYIDSTSYFVPKPPKK